MGPLFDPNWYKDENYEKFKSIQNGNNNNLASLSGVYSTLGNTAQLVGDVASMTQADDSMGHNKLNTYKNISVGAADSIEGLHSIERNITSTPNISWSDVGGKSGGEVGAGILKGAGSGAILGASIASVVPGLGTAIGGAVGAGVGAIASGIGSIFGSNKAKRQRRRLQEQAELAHQKQLADFQVQVGNVNQNITDKAQFNSFGIGGCLSPFNIFAQGGYVPQQKNVSTHIDNGGTHEMNKLGGVPMGVADDGQPNLVEQGEVVYNDYVYSNRLSPDEKLLKKYGLPTKYRGKTYANIAKALEKEIEERKNDSISKLGYETNMKKLQSAHEEHKQLLEQAQQQDMLQNYTQGLTPQYAGVQEYANSILANKDNYSPTLVERANFAHNVAGWKHDIGGHLFEIGGPKIPPVPLSTVQRQRLAKYELGLVQPEALWTELSLTDEQRKQYKEQLKQYKDNLKRQFNKLNKNRPTIPPVRRDAFVAQRLSKYGLNLVQPEASWTDEQRKQYKNKLIQYNNNILKINTGNTDYVLQGLHALENFNDLGVDKGKNIVTPYDERTIGDGIDFGLNKNGNYNNPEIRKILKSRESKVYPRGYLTGGEYNYFYNKNVQSHISSIKKDLTNIGVKYDDLPESVQLSLLQRSWQTGNATQSIQKLRNYLQNGDYDSVISYMVQGSGMKDKKESANRGDRLRSYLGLPNNFNPKSQKSQFENRPKTEAELVAEENEDFLLNPNSNVSAYQFFNPEEAIKQRERINERINSKKSFYSPIKDMVSFVLNPGIPETTDLIDKNGNEIPLPTIADKLGIPTDVSNKINKITNFVTDPIGNLIYMGTGNETLATIGSAVVGAINPKGYKGYIPKKTGLASRAKLPDPDFVSAINHSRTGLASRAKLPDPDFVSAMNHSRTGLASRAKLPDPDFVSAMNRGLIEKQAKKPPKETRKVLENEEKTSKLNTNSKEGEIIKEEQAKKLSNETRKALKNEERKKDYIPKNPYSNTGLPGSRYIKREVGKFKNLTEKQAERLSKETREALENNDTYTLKEVNKRYKTDINNNKKKLEKEISELSTNLKEGKITEEEYKKELTNIDNEFVKKKNEIENKYTFNQKHPWIRSILYPSAGLGGLGFGTYELFRDKNNNTTEETPNIESRNENNNTTEETPNTESSEIEIKPVKTDTEIPIEDTLNFTKEFQDSLMSKAFMNKALGGHLFEDGGSPKGTRKTYAYDKNMNNFAHYHNGKYDQGYLDFLNNMTQDDWDRYYKTYLNNNPNAFDRYNTAYNGQPTLQQAIALGQDGKYSDLHKMLGDTYSAIKNNTWFDTSDEVLPDLEYNYIITPFKTTVDTSQVDNMMKNRKKNYNVPAPYDYNSYLRYAPVISSGINAITDAFGWTNRPDYSGINEIENAYKNAPYVHYQPLKHYMKYQPIDRDYYLNKYNNQFANSRDLISRGTNGNSAQNALMQLVNNKTYNEGVADQEMRANLYNQNERNKVYDFNRATDQYNSQQDFNAQSTNANLYRQDISALHQLLEERKAEQQAAAALRNANRQNLLQNLYNIGEEAYNRNTINYLAKRGALDTYLTPADRYRYWNAYANQNENR